jgi:hypothetical protein
MVERLQEGNESGSLVGTHGRETIARCLGFAAMPQDRFGQIARAPVVQEMGMTADGLGEPDAP